MKNNKLYPINQFIDYVFDMNINLAEKAVLIYKYRRFLERPLIGEMLYKKMFQAPKNYGNWHIDMIVPDDLESTKWYNKCLEYYDQKSKIIFPDAKRLSTSKYSSEVYIGDYHIGHVDEEEDEWFNYNTLNDLAEDTYGNISLQNVIFTS